MIKALTAYTTEIDDTDKAVSDILGQLTGLRAHSLGIISCYTEFVETGVTQALCEALPFDVIGCTTAGNAVTGTLGELMLCLMVLTDDDIIFSTGVSGSLAEEQETTLSEAYQQARDRLVGEPSLMILFAPMITQVTGELVVEILNKINPSLPLFGAVAVDYIDITEFSKSYTLFNGRGCRDTLSFALVYGDVHPSFFAATISNVHIQKQKAVITKSQGHCVMEVNGMSLPVYLEKLGMLGLNKGTNLSFPFTVDYQDGTKPTARAIYSVTPDGYVVFTGRMPVGATLAVGDIDYPDVLHTAAEVLDKLLKQNGSCILLFSCLTRYIVLDADTTAEMELVCAALDADKPYHFAYSGGEICPVYNEKGRLINRLHNFGIIACVL